MTTPTPEELRRYGLALACDLYGVYVQRKDYGGYSAWIDEKYGNRQVAEGPTILDTKVAAAEVLGLSPVSLGGVPAEYAALRKAAVDVCDAWQGPFEKSGFREYPCHPQCVWCADGDESKHDVRLHMTAKRLRAALSSSPKEARPALADALAILTRWQDNMDHPEGAPLEIHHADIQTLRVALTGPSAPETTKEDNVLRRDVVHTESNGGQIANSSTPETKEAK